MQAVIILGSNSGNKYKIIEEAITILSQKAGKAVMASSLYETEPWGFTCDEYFVNQVVVFDTRMTPQEFLRLCLETEKQLGRMRLSGGPRYSPRPIDIDILFYDSLILDTPELTIPHPRLAERNFVLVPLQEIMPGFIHPAFHKTITELLRECRDKMKVVPVN